MSNLIKFAVEGKELYLFELDGKVATIAPELMIFEGYANAPKAWFDIKEREGFEENYEFKTLQGEDLKIFKSILKDSNESSLVITDLVKTLYEQYKSVPRLDIVLEEGIIGVMYASNSNHANAFKKFMRREVNPKLNKEGKFDVVENQIIEIEDETEKQLQLKIYRLEQVLEISPEDRIMSITLNDTKKELELYRQNKKLEQVENSVKELTQTVVEIEKVNKVLQEQSKFICDRTNFYERVKILANKYFGRDIQKAYQELFSTMKMLGSFDVYSRRKNEWEKINAERGKSNKKPLKDSSLKSKYNFLDVIDDYNKWELASEAYKMIENKFVSV